MGYKLFIITSLFFAAFWGQSSERHIVSTQHTHVAMMPEICDNGIDDDMDGFTDLNDPDCDCQEDIEYYVPNPSFEATCCPCQRDPMTMDCIGLGLAADVINCISPWINSTSVGFDIYNACYQPPFPGPEHQDGFIGMFTRGSGTGMIVYKEYAITCLNETLQAGEAYDVGLSFGFGGSEVDPMDDVEISVFGTANCIDSNYNADVGSFGCPANNPLWRELATFTFRGNTGWLRDTLTFIAPADINMLAFGSSCAEDLIFVDGFFHYMDQIELVYADDRELNISIAGADLCAGVGKLSITPKPDATYQWYKDGIALVGETTPMLSLPGTNPNGSYQIRIINPRGCFLSEAYTFLREPILIHVTPTICEGEFYLLGTEVLTAEGQFIDTLQSTFGCDSIVTVDLTIIDRKRTDNPQDICLGQSIQVGSNVYSVEGIYADTLMAITGCDSIVHTDLTVRMPGRAEFIASICQGDSITIGNVIYKLPGNYLDTLVAINGCDSLIQLDLSISPNFELLERYVICPGDTLDIHGEMLTEAGDYIFEFVTDDGCDSTIQVIVEISQNPMTLPGQQDVLLGETLSITPQLDVPNIDTVFWHPSPLFGLSEPSDIDHTIIALQSGYLTIEAIDTSGCMWIDSIHVRVRKPYDVFIPNIFTPNSDGLNDFFVPYLNTDVQSIRSLMIVNRWGDIVFTSGAIGRESFSLNMGWNGLRSGQEAEAGVYIYTLQVEFIDGVVRTFYGDLTLMR